MHLNFQILFFLNKYWLKFRKIIENCWYDKWLSISSYFSSPKTKYEKFWYYAIIKLWYITLVQYMQTCYKMKSRIYLYQIRFAVSYLQISRHCILHLFENIFVLKEYIILHLLNIIYRNWLNKYLHVLFKALFFLRKINFINILNAQCAH